MNYNIETGVIAAGAFFVIGCLTWFFSSRRKTFIRTFVPADQLREASRSILRDKSFGQGMRFIGVLQMGTGVLIALSTWLTR